MPRTRRFSSETEDDQSDPPERDLEPHDARPQQPFTGFGAPIELDRLLPTPPLEITPPPEAPLPLIAVQREAMAQAFRQVGLTLAGLRIEMLQVARAAAAEGEYQASGALYKTIAQTFGAIQGDKHLHLHAADPQNPTHDANGPLKSVDYRSTTDDELRALIARARNQNTIVDAPAATPE